MTDVRRIHHHRALDDEAPWEPVTTTPPPQHALWLIKRAASVSSEGDFQQTITELCHAVLVALEKGKQGVDMHEYVHALRGVAGYGFPWDDPDRAA